MRWYFFVLLFRSASMMIFSRFFMGIYLQYNLNFIFYLRFLFFYFNIKYDEYIIVIIHTWLTASFGVVWPGWYKKKKKHFENIKRWYRWRRWWWCFFLIFLHTFTYRLMPSKLTKRYFVLLRLRCVHVCSFTKVCLWAAPPHTLIHTTTHTITMAFNESRLSVREHLKWRPNINVMWRWWSYMIFIYTYLHINNRMYVYGDDE